MAGAMINEGSYKVCFIWVSKMFHEGFKDILRGIFEVVIKNLKRASSMFQDFIKEISMTFQGCFKKF